MERYVTVGKAGEILGIKVRTVRAWIHSGRLKAIKYPGSMRWFIAESEIERLTKGEGNENKD